MARNSQRRYLRLSLALGFMTVILLVLVVAWTQSLFGKAPQLFSAELEKAKQDGMLISTEAVERAATVPDNENAASGLERTFQKCDEWLKSNEGKEYKKIRHYFNGASTPTSAQLAQLKELLPGTEAITHEVNRAVVRPRLDFHRLWSKGFGLDFPELSHAKEVVNLLIGQARVQWKDGNRNGALASCLDAAKLGNRMGQEPTMISVLMQCGINTQVLSCLNDFLHDRPYDTELLRSCRTIIAASKLQHNAREVISYEFAMGISMIKLMDRPGVGKLFGDSGVALGRLLKFGPARNVLSLRYVQVMHDLYMQLGRNPDSILAMKHCTDKVDERLKGNKDWTYTMVEIMTPTFSGLTSAVGNDLARKNITLEAVNLLEGHATSGSFKPKGDVLKDPFTDKSLAIRSDKSGFLVYSVGPDLKDDGGRSRGNGPRSGEGNSTFDIVFSFP